MGHLPQPARTGHHDRLLASFVPPRSLFWIWKSHKLALIGFRALQHLRCPLTNVMCQWRTGGVWLGGSTDKCEAMLIDRCIGTYLCARGMGDGIVENAPRGRGTAWPLRYQVPNLLCNSRKSGANIVCFLRTTPQGVLSATYRYSQWVTLGWHLLCVRVLVSAPKRCDPAEVAARVFSLGIVAHDRQRRKGPSHPRQTLRSEAPASQQTEAPMAARQQPGNLSDVMYCHSPVCSHAACHWIIL